MDRRSVIKRAMLLILIISLFPISSPSSAQNASLSLDVSNTLKAGKTFEVMVSSPIPLCAIELDVRYDASVLKYQSAKSAFFVGEIRTCGTADGVRLICTRANAKDGSLMKLSFKALADTATEVTFTPLSAAISNEELYDFESAVTLALSIGDNPSFRSRTTPKSASLLGNESALNSGTVSVSSPDERGLKELSGFSGGTNHLRIVLIAGGAAMLVGTALALGFRLRKSVKKTKPSPPDSAVKDETETTDNQDNEKS